MKNAIKFLSKILEFTFVGSVIFVLPAIIHSIFTFTNHYMSDISNDSYCVVMSLVTTLGSVFYIAIEADRIDSIK